MQQTNKSIFWWQNQKLKQLFEPSSFIHLNLNINRELLYKNCNWRFAKMFENGAVEEVKKLLETSVTEQMQITKTLGFYEIADFLAQKISAQDAIKIASQKTRNYAKRQLTWFRNQLPTKIVFEETKQALQYLKSL